MPLQNRVTPEGEIISSPARGTLMGNRGGALHDATKTLRRRRWVSRQWICCRLAFKGRHREVMAPQRYTELFFLDEATSLAAGHRPCFECRREDALAFARLWSEARGLTQRATAASMDGVLQAERLCGKSLKRVYEAPAPSLPSGAFVRVGGQPMLVLDAGLLGWTPQGYVPPRPLPTGPLTVLTPPSIVAVLRAGYGVRLHPSAGRRSSAVRIEPSTSAR